VKEGKFYRDKELDFGFYGHRYYLMPKIAIPNKELLEKTLNIIKKYKKVQSLPDGRLIAHEEERLLFIAQELNDYISLIFEFYNKPQKDVERIVLLMGDILPSRIVNIFKLKQELEKFPIFQDNEIQFDFLSNFFKMPGDRQSKHQGCFFMLVEAAFKGKPIDKKHLLNLSMQILRPLFVEEEKSNKIHQLSVNGIFRVFITLLFYQKLELFKKERREIMITEPYVEFFNTYEEFFNIPIKRATFLLGVLTKKLLNYQWKEKNSSPFRKQLKGLRMAANDFKALLPKVQGKLMEYDADWYPELEKAISYYFMQAGANWNIGGDELNFCFVLGMNFVSEEPFKPKKEEES